MSDLWPSARTVAAAMRGTVREVLTLKTGERVVGVSSAIPHVKVVTPWLAGHSAGALCEECETFEVMPDPPASMAAGEARTALLEMGTQGHAVFALTWMHTFARAHKHEVPA